MTNSHFVTQSCKVIPERTALMTVAQWEVAIWSNSQTLYQPSIRTSTNWKAFPPVTSLELVAVPIDDIDICWQYLGQFQNYFRLAARWHWQTFVLTSKSSLGNPRVSLKSVGQDAPKRKMHLWETIITPWNNMGMEHDALSKVGNGNRRAVAHWNNGNDTERVAILTSAKMEAWILWFETSVFLAQKKVKWLMFAWSPENGSMKVINFVHKMWRGN